ncbi:uncharacterized protein I206_102273 [Kwoniella pini CBS 10737]|uniref:Uncharacterized protein n=1 Tax=Kwoniella pini CBS 10737 TaxID=1296096 RepID=A0A1B9HT10_9TREE|nr:uncharacterized protein I206_07643 [Kwoniella pini CBS 10737]OCF46409.1 hypothetical protein I206_07643 [Kwoniella pini CBS 10737]
MQYYCNQCDKDQDTSSSQYIGWCGPCAVNAARKQEAEARKQKNIAQKLYKKASKKAMSQFGQTAEFAKQGVIFAGTEEDHAAAKARLVICEREK